MKRKIFVVDDHPLLRKGYSYLLAQQGDLEICGEAGSVAQAVDRIPTSKPDLVITDIALDGASGLELIRWLHIHMPHLPILVVSMHEENVYAWRCFRAGARGYVVKGRSEAIIIEAIRKLVRGGLFLSEQMAEQMIGSMHEGNGRVDDPIRLLSGRELEVFTQCGRGLTTKEISEVLHISPKTVESHRIKIREKLGVSSNAELVRRAVQSVGNEKSAA